MRCDVYRQKGGLNLGESIKLKGRLQTVPIDNLREHPDNPKTISRKMLQKLRESLETLGYIMPILVNREMVVLDGHQRLKVFREQGVDEVEVLVVDTDSNVEDMMALIVSDLIYGEVQEKELAELLEVLENHGIDTEFLREEPELEEEYIGAPPRIEDDEYTPDESVEQCVGPGDVVLIETKRGKHIIICRDSTSDEIAELLSTLMHENAIPPPRIIFADPPYDMDADEIYTAVSNFVSISLDPHIFYMAYDQQLHSLMQIEDSHFRSFLVFRTKSQVREGLYYYRRHILMAHYIVGDEPLPFHNLMEGTETMVDLPYRRTFPDKIHEYQKPLDAISYFIRPYIETGITIGDPFAGTGTIAVMADMLSCNSVSVEIDPGMVSIAVDRFRNYDPDAKIWIGGEPYGR